MIKRLALALTLGTLLLAAGSASADPLRFVFTGRVTYPEKPALTITAEEPVTALSIALAPEVSAQDQGSGESAPQHLNKASLGKEQKVVFHFGTGKSGITRWKGTIQCRGADGKEWKKDANFETQVSHKLEITYDTRNPSPHLDLENRFVEVQITEPAGSAEIRVTADDGTELGGGNVTFKGEPPGTWLRVPWEGKAIPKGDAVVLRLALTLYSSAGTKSKVDLYPWSVTVPHQEVNFETKSWDIADSERSKLDESYAKLSALLARVEKTLRSFADRGAVATTPPPITLYVAGHTDTVGTDADNLKLSHNRAKAIASYFRQKGLKLPILFAGLGERQPRVKTADNVDEVRNRRADYTMALILPPALPSIGWQSLQ